MINENFTAQFKQISRLIGKVQPEEATVSYLPNAVDYKDDNNNFTTAYLYYNYLNVHIVGTDFIEDKTAIQALQYNQILYFQKEPENEYDENAILFVDENNQAVGYISKGHFQDMINDYLDRKLIVVAFITNSSKLLVELGFYQFKPYPKTLAISSSKNECQENLQYCSHHDRVDIEQGWCDDFCDKITVCNQYGETIGTIKNENLIDCKAYIHSIEETDSGKLKVRIAVLN